MTALTHPHLIDFHSHYYDASWYPSPQGPSALSRSWPLLTDIQAQLAAMDEAGIDAKVLSAPSATLLRPGEPCPADLMKRINDRFAELVSTYPDRLLALATIDAFGSESGAREVERAIQGLGLGGICIDCARPDRYLDVPSARPVLEAAAALGAAIFVHPVSPLGLTEHLARLGRMGTFVARGTETAASVLALLRSGLFDQLPTLRVVIPMIGAAAFWFAGLADQERGRDGDWQGTPPSELRKRLYVDTMGFDPMAIHAVVELLGPEHVLLGSDWPSMSIMRRQQIQETLTDAHLGPAQQRAITGDNTLRLLTRAAPISQSFS